MHVKLFLQLGTSAKKRLPNYERSVNAQRFLANSEAIEELVSSLVV